MTAAVSPTNPKSVIIDCDPGVDDTLAILFALGSPELDVKAITTVCGNVPLEVCTKNALKVLELAGRTDVPVHPGCDRPMIGEPIFGKFHGAGGLGKLVLPEPVTKPQSLHAVEKMAELLRAAKADQTTLTICNLGPMTNLAVLIKLYPDLLSAIDRVVSMGGAYRIAGNRTLTSEFNMLADPHAASIVYSAGLNYVALPLDATHQAMTSPERIAWFEGGKPGSPLAATHELLSGWARNDPKRYGSDGGPMHDPLVTVYLVAPQLFQSELARVFVECDSKLCYGQTVADWYEQSGEVPNAQIVQKVYADGVFSILSERIRSLSQSG
ncbi:nucleoside hydrolase [uncultured Cohaesibacter sp.]|uniref:nucleoside hydrolase n=1 Tax=uncultured Cohaesibacter sp. TaxID=1002546 RepID=UPI0029C99064|nr:nucleoside hydrolase [uncultured Cohaesibacter sp.]